MQIRTLISLMRSGKNFSKLQPTSDFQVLLRMNYSSKVSDSLADRLIGVINKKMPGVDIKMYKFKFVEIYKYSFALWGRKYKARIDAWSDPLDAKINAIIQSLK